MTSVDRPVDRRRNQSTGQSTGVHNVHRSMPVDHPVDRGMNGREQDALGLGPVDRTVDLDMGRSTGQPIDAFWLFFIDLDSFLVGIESSWGFLKPRDSVAINKG